MLGSKMATVGKLRFVNQNTQRRKLEQRMEISQAEYDGGKRPWNQWQKSYGQKLFFIMMGI